MGELIARLGAMILGKGAGGGAPSPWGHQGHRRGAARGLDGLGGPRGCQRPSSAPHSGDLPPAALQRYRALEARTLKRLRLSPRESEVAASILQGATYRDIGEKLFIAESTVRFHARHIFEKAQVDNRRAFERSMRRWLVRSAAECDEGRTAPTAGTLRGPIER